MNTKTLLTITCLLLFGTLCFSQKSYHKVSLNSNTISIEANFTCVEVIDKRLVKENIGYAQKGLGNRKVVAKLDGRFEEVIKNCVNKIILTKQEPEEIIFIFHELNVSERTSSMSEKGICRIEIEFAKLIDSVYYSLGSFSTEIEGGGIDVTKKHGNRIIKCLKNCILDFDKMNSAGLKIGDVIELDEQEHSYDFNEKPNKGMYSSFNKLGKNEPMDDFEIVFEPFNGSSKAERYSYDVVDKKDKNKRVLFISDGENLYMHASRYCYQKHFIKSKHIGKYIYFEDKFSNGDAVVGFGLLGAAISNKKRGMILDSTNGMVSLLTDTKLAFLTRGHHEILAEYKKSKRKLVDKENVIIKLNEKFSE